MLVDDVLTTGATLGRLYQCLSQAGAQVSAAAVLAATPEVDSVHQPSILGRALPARCFSA